MEPLCPSHGTFTAHWRSLKVPLVVGRGPRSSGPGSIAKELLQRAAAAFEIYTAEPFEAQQER